MTFKLNINYQFKYLVIGINKKNGKNHLLIKSYTRTVYRIFKNIAFNLKTNL